MENLKGHGITVRSNERERLFGEPDRDTCTCWHAWERGKLHADISSQNCRPQLMETLKPKAQSKEEKRRFMEILPSTKEEYPERQGRGQKHGCSNIKLPSE